MGYRYRSRALLEEVEAAGSQDEIVLLESQELTGVPGTRVPHLWLEWQGQRISTLDLLDGRFVLLTGPDGAPWYEAAAVAAASLSIELAAYSIGPGGDLLDLEHGWSTGMGVSSEGAVLVRPDGFVAWRSSTLTTAPAPLLEQVLAHILCRSTAPSLQSPPCATYCADMAWGLRRGGAARPGPSFFAPTAPGFCVRLLHNRDRRAHPTLRAVLH